MFSVNTKIITPYFRYRYERTAKALERAAEEQRALLKRLLELATDTEWGHKYGYGDMGGYEDFAQRVPLSSYEDLKGYIDRMRHGENDVLWPGRVKFYAKSSGTTNDKSKYLGWKTRIITAVATAWPTFFTIIPRATSSAAGRSFWAVATNRIMM